MNLSLFTYAEAQAKRGLRVCTRLTLIGIPNGTTGTVQRVEQTLDGCVVVVQWDVPRSPICPRWPPEDKFSKDSYETYLVEAAEEIGEKPA